MPRRGSRIFWRRNSGVKPMLEKLLRTVRTVRYMRPGQIVCRLRKMAGRPCSLGKGYRTAETWKTEKIRLPEIPEELDFDPVFLERYPAEEFCRDRVTFLHVSEDVSWEKTWEFPKQTALWNYNLHYFDYLFPLIYAWRQTGKNHYFDKTRQMIAGWIRANPREKGGCGWNPYPTALRLTNWLGYYTYCHTALQKDEPFRRLLLDSLLEQYRHLSVHLEKDLLGNHYFEDLKTLVLCALFFSDAPVLERALVLLKEQCRQQILPDGLHYELSPMYHNIVLEDVMRVALALRGAGQQDSELEAVLPSMLDAAYSLEEGLDRLPLFNDGGNNACKSLSALLAAAENHFGLQPRYRAAFPDSGYYVLKNGDVKVIIDAGRAGPDEIPGHAHCDALSFECFVKGKPVWVNCGTYAYQDELRPFFRSTLAHNTVQVAGTEQSECWGAFRLARRQQSRCLEATREKVVAEMTDQKGHTVRRTVMLTEKTLTVEDQAQGCLLEAALHAAPDFSVREDAGRLVLSDGSAVELSTPAVITAVPYAPEYGQKQECSQILYTGRERLGIRWNYQ